MTRKCVITAHTRSHTGSIVATTAAAFQMVLSDISSSSTTVAVETKHLLCLPVKFNAIANCFFFAGARLSFFSYRSIILCAIFLQQPLLLQGECEFFFSVDLCFKCCQILVRRRNKKRIRGIFLLRSGMCSIVCNVYIILLR